MSALVPFECRPCPICGDAAVLWVTPEARDARRAGALVQDAFPTMPRAEREQAVSGTHPACWLATFGPGPS